MKRLITLFSFLIFSVSVFSQVVCGERNEFTVLINTYNQLFVESEVMDIMDLKDAVKEYIANPNNNPYYSGRIRKEIPYLGQMDVSDGLISLQCDRNTTYQKYIDVQNELEKAFNELRNELALEKFNTCYKSLSKAKQKAIDKAIPKSISEAVPRYVEKNGELVENRNWNFRWY